MREDPKIYRKLSKVRIYLQGDGIELLMCVICSTVLLNESKKPSKLQRHLQTTHSHLEDKLVEYFQTSLKSLRGQQTLIRKSAKVGEQALKCSRLQTPGSRIYQW